MSGAKSTLHRKGSPRPHCRRRASAAGDLDGEKRAIRQRVQDSESTAVGMRSNAATRAHDKWGSGCIPLVRRPRLGRGRPLQLRRCPPRCADAHARGRRWRAAASSHVGIAAGHWWAGGVFRSAQTFHMQHDLCFECAGEPHREAALRGYKGTPSLKRKQCANPVQGAEELPSRCPGIYMNLPGRLLSIQPRSVVGCLLEVGAHAPSQRARSCESIPVERHLEASPLRDLPLRSVASRLPLKSTVRGPIVPADG